MRTEQITAGASILVVDDNHDNLRTLTKLLSDHGYRVRPVSDGVTALSSAQTEPPDLILLDIIMPGMSGHEVCSKLKADERTRNIPVIFISALSEVLDKVRAFFVGGVDYITKPFQAEEVLARIETHLTLVNLQHHLRQKNALLRQEIEAHKYTEKRLLDSEKRHRSMFENAPVGIFQLSPEGKCLAANAALTRILGYDSPKELITTVTNVAEQLFVDPHDWHDMMEITRENQEKTTAESRCRCKDGREMIASLNMWAVRDEQGEVRYFEGFIEDITERRQVEQALNHHGRK